MIYLVPSLVHHHLHFYLPASQHNHMHALTLLMVYCLLVEHLYHGLVPGYFDDVERNHLHLGHSGNPKSYSYIA